MLAQTLHDISLKFKRDGARPRLVGGTTDHSRFRVVVIAAMVVSIVIMWPMWGPREYPIVLPAAALRQKCLFLLSRASSQ